MKNFVDNVLNTEDTITISLLVTEKCPFECAHCMYADRLRGELGYITPETLENVRLQVEYLREQNIYCEINLVGGEPTTNMSEFKRVLDTVSGWGVRVTMTTNGWWLRSKELSRRFFEIVAPHVNGYCWEESLSIRISDDKYHREFAPKNLSILLDECWNWLFWEDVYCCQECGEEYEEYIDECPECGSDDIYEETRETYFNLDVPTKNNDWIYVEKYRDDGIIAIGNAEGWGDINYSYPNGCYDSITEIGYNVDGTFFDICCKGSWVGAGSAADNPVALIATALRMKDEVKPNCCECRIMIDEWVAENWDKVYAEALEETEKILSPM